MNILISEGPTYRPRRSKTNLYVYENSKEDESKLRWPNGFIVSSAALEWARYLKGTRLDLLQKKKEKDYKLPTCVTHCFKKLCFK